MRRILVIVAIVLNMCGSAAAADLTVNAKSHPALDLNEFQAALYLDCSVTADGAAMPARFPLNLIALESATNRAARSAEKQVRSLKGLRPVQIGCLGYSVLEQYAIQQGLRYSHQKYNIILRGFSALNDQTCATLASGFSLAPAEQSVISTSCGL